MNCKQIKNLAKILAAVIVLLGTICEAAVSSKNLNENEYTRWAKPIKSYLYVAGDYLIRVENIGSRVIVEQYTDDFRFVRSLDFEGTAADIFGGFFSGRDANYVIVGKANDAESDRAEVIRVMKFNKDWNLLKEAKVHGANTKMPFAFASLRCAENGGNLYIRTGHQMFRTPDGLNHQSNMYIVVDEAKMEVTHMDYLVRYDFIGYVGHSFNQFILIDAAKNVVMLDQGDAFPRAIVLNRYKNSTQTVELVKIPGQVGDNATGAALGGLAETANNYVVACSYDNAGGDPNDYFGVVKRRDLYLAFTSKRNFSTGGTKFVKVPLPAANTGAGTPFLVPVNQNLGYVIWNETKFDGKYFVPTGRICGARYDDSGNVVFVGVGEGQLSDCQPIIYKNRAVWYVTNNSAPVFYTFDGNRLEAHKAR